MDENEQLDEATPRSGYVPLTTGSSSPAATDGGDSPSRKKKLALAAALLVLLIAAVAIAVWWNASRSSDAMLNADPNVKVGSITGNTQDLDKIVDEGMLTFSINSTPVFDNGTAPGNLMIENSEINNNRFTVEITRDDTGETVYKSGALDPGQYIDDVPLDANLPAGEYTCTATFSTYKLSDNSPIGQAAAGLTITVLN